MSTMDGLGLFTQQAAMACFNHTPVFPKGRLWRQAMYDEQRLDGGYVLVRLKVDLVRTERDDRDDEPQQTYVLHGEVTDYGPDALPTWHSCRIYQVDLPDVFYSFDVGMTGTCGMISIREDQQLRLMRTCNGEVFGGGAPRWWTSNADLSDAAMASVMFRFAGELYHEYGFRLERLQGDQWELVRSYA